MVNTSGEIAPDPLSFTRGATFISANLKALRASPKSVTGLLELSLRLLEDYPDTFMASSDDGSVNVIDIADANETVRHAEQQSESSIVRSCYDKSQIKVTAISHSS